MGRPIGHPHVSFTIDKESVRKCDLTLAETLHKFPIHIKFDDRVQVRVRAAVRAAAVENPPVLAIGIHSNAGRYSNFSALQLVPVVIHVIWIHRYLLRLQSRARNHGEPRRRRTSMQILVNATSLTSRRFLLPFYSYRNFR